ncbi:hypothetical protein HK103_000440 [Boothiomyces macroporosus]|uniref:F-box domain-containing protein n=1 Tax=Boothiomyces macroporosus TaxID=261099 RepID=A0AAD5UF69_9FUNG|nr:hypothetical protein HK103_000440 [Boothiomyces macroporosus]
MLLTDLPFDVLEFQIYYYLDGYDIWQLSRVNRLFRERLQPFIKLLGATKKHPSEIWPTMQLEGLEETQKFRQLNMQQWKVKFPSIIIDSNSFLRLHNRLPKSSALSLHVSNFSKFIMRKNRLNCSVKNVTCIDIDRMGNHDNLSFDILKEMKLNEVRLGESHRNSFEKIVKILPALHITKLSLSMSITSLSHAKLLFQEVCKMPVTFLALCMMALTDECTPFLAEMLPKSSITELLILYTQIGKTGLDRIAHVLPKTKLKALRFENANPESDLYLELFKILPQTQITKLWCDNLSSEQVQNAIIDNLAKSKVTNAHLFIEPRNLERFIRQRKLVKFKNSCPIEDEGCEILSRNSIFLPNELDVSDCEITNSGISTLLDGMVKSDIKLLVLDGNCFDENGLEIVKKKLKYTPLERLSLGNTHLGYTISEKMLTKFLDGLESNLKAIQINNVVQAQMQIVKGVVVQYYADPAIMSILGFEEAHQGLEGVSMDETLEGLDEFEEGDFATDEEESNESDFVHEESESESEDSMDEEEQARIQDSD